MKNMNAEKSTTSSSHDLKHSFSLLFKNYKPFLKVQIFAISLTLVMFFIIIGIGFVYRTITGNPIQDEPLRRIEIQGDRR